MKHGSSLLLALGLVALACPARADRTFTVGADSLVFSQTGSLVRITESDVPATTFLAFETPTMIAISAERSDTDGVWEVLDPGQFYCPALSMAIGTRWRFLDDDQGNLRSAEVVAFESLTVPAGTFNAWKVHVSLDDQPGTVTRTLWFANGVGMIREVSYSFGIVASRSVLQSYSRTGAGFFPLVEGNTWHYVNQTLDTRASSMSAFKGRFDR